MNPKIYQRAFGALCFSLVAPNSLLKLFLMSCHTKFMLKQTPPALKLHHTLVSHPFAHLISSKATVTIKSSQWAF